jgi:serine phosphatase RsbU (regulator of sigma subunit)
MIPFQTHEVQINPEDRIYLFSDGMQDQFGGPKRKKFKSKNIRNLIVENSSLSMKEQGNVILSRFEEWKKEVEQVDDVTFLGIRF